MAETDDSDSTGEWRLLSDEYKFVLTLTKGSEKVADQVLRDFLEGGASQPKFLNAKNEAELIPGVDYSHARYRFWQVEGWSGGRWPNPFKSQFWRSDPERNMYSQISYRDSSARWTGPVQYDLRSISKENIALEWKVMGHPTTANYRVSLIWLHHETLLAALRAIGLLPPLATSETSNGTESPESPAPEPDAAEPVDEPVDEPVAEPVAEPVVEPVAEPVAESVTGSPLEKPHFHGRPPGRRAEALLRLLYPDGLPPEATKGELVLVVDRNWDDERVPNLGKLSVSSPDTIERVIDHLRSIGWICRKSPQCGAMR